MSSPMKMLDFYTGVWKLVGAVVSGDGFVRIQDEKDKTFEQVMFDDKPVVIPTPEQLQPNLTERVIFNPLLEDIDKAESLSLAAYREQTTKCLNSQAMDLLANVLCVGFDPNQAGALSEEQMVFLEPIGKHKVNPERFLANVELLMRKSRAKTERSLVGIYLKRSGEVGKKRYRAVSVVSFPLLEELVACEETQAKAPYGVKMPKEERALLREMLEAIYPTDPALGEETWMSGSDDPFSPKFSSLAMALRKVLAANIRVGLLFKQHMTLKNKELYTAEELMALMIDTRPMEMERRYFRGIGDCSSPVTEEVRKRVEAATAAPAETQTTTAQAAHAPVGTDFMSQARAAMAAPRQTTPANSFAAMMPRQATTVDPQNPMAFLQGMAQGTASQPRGADFFRAASQAQVSRGSSLGIVGASAGRQSGLSI